MSIAKAHSLNQAYQLLNSGKQKEVELAFDMDADTCFQRSAEDSDEGGKITRQDKHFVSKLKSMAIPARH